MFLRRLKGFRQEGFAKGWKLNLLLVHWQGPSVIQNPPAKSLQWAEYHLPTAEHYGKVCSTCQRSWLASGFVFLPVKTSSLFTYSWTFSQRKQQVPSKAGCVGDISIQFHPHSCHKRNLHMKHFSPEEEHAFQATLLRIPACLLCFTRGLVSECMKVIPLG